MKIKIKVTKEIQQKAMMCGYTTYCGQLLKVDSYPDYTQHCEVAEAVREIFPRVMVGYSGIEGPHIFGIKFLNGDEIPITSGLATRRIKQFDNLVPEDRVKQDSYEFEIKVPEKIIDQIGLSEVHRILKESKTLELCP